MSAGTLLMFNFQRETADALRLAVSPLGLACREVLPQEHRLPLRALLTGEGPAPSPLAAPAFDDPLLVFSIPDRPALDRLLDLVRPLTRGVLKAVVTPTNLFWTGERLARELNEERRRLGGP